MTSLPADAAVLVAAVADWRVEPAPSSSRRATARQASSSCRPATSSPSWARGRDRPRLLIGFAAETDDVVERAVAKREAKKADWIVANDVSGDVMGGTPTTACIWSRATESRIGPKPPRRLSRAAWSSGSPRRSHDRDQAQPPAPWRRPAAARNMPPSMRAGLDVCAAEELTLEPGRRHAVATGFAHRNPATATRSRCGPRSGLALKHGITCLNTPGTIDSDYRGEVKVILVNLGDEPFPIRRGERIAQLVPAAVLRADFVEAEALGEIRAGRRRIRIAPGGDRPQRRGARPLCTTHRPPCSSAESASAG